MYPFPVGLALIEMIADRPDRRHIHGSRLELAARLARQGRGDYDERQRPSQPRRPRLAWLRTRGRAAA